MSRRDQLFQAVNNVQGQVFGFVDQHLGQVQPGNRTNGQAAAAATSGQQNNGRPGGSSSVRRSDTTTTLPLYSHAPNAGSQAAPSSVLSAAPGQAQAAADQLPQSRMANGTGREARAAAAALREEQLRTGVLKTQHTFISSGARVVLDVYTLPQRKLTFMGGTAERGTGAIKGAVTIHAQPNERVSAIRLKIKAVVAVKVPRVGVPQQPFPLESTHPSIEPCVEKEILLLQLESPLYDAKSNASPDNPDPTILPVGRHEYPFTIDLPCQSGKGVDLPPSFILSPLNTPDQVQRPQPKNKWESITSAIPMPQMSHDWASVKWYMKLTVERPGLLRTNERIFAPFVYLPPPPKMRGMQEQLAKRLRLASECDSLLRQFNAIQGARPIDLQRLHEPFAQWESIRLAYGMDRKPKAPTQSAPGTTDRKNGKQGLFSKMLFGSQNQPEQSAEVLREVYTLHLPKKPFVFAVRSGIPYVISRSVEWSGRGSVASTSLSRVPTVGLFQRANLYARGRGPVAGTTSRFVSSGRQPPDTQAVFVKDERTGTGNGQGQKNKRVEYWLGLIDLPPACTPCFETPILTLEYYIGVRSPASPNLVHTEPIVLVCPPAKPVRVPVTASQPPSRTGTPNSDASRRRRRQGSADASSTMATSSTPLKQATNMAGIGSNKVALDDNKTQSAALSPPTLHTGRRPSSGQTASQQTVVASPVPSTSNQPASSSTRAQDEKKAMQTRYDEQMRAHGQQQPSSSPSSSAAAGASAQVAPPPPPPRPQAASSTEQSVSASQGGQQQASVVASDVQRSDAIAPLTLDDDATADDPQQWIFQDDELADLPPSYFEATGMHDND